MWADLGGAGRDFLIGVQNKDLEKSMDQGEIVKYMRGESQ
jgi:hypothetical protein